MLYIIILLFLVFILLYFFQNKGVPCIMYHSISDEKAINSKNFEEQLELMKNYATFKFEELEEVHCTLPKNSILLTFDDGYKDNYTNAFPLLKKYNMKATIFLNTAYIGTDPEYLNWEEIKEMYESGLVDFQLHTHSHLTVIRKLEIEGFFTEEDKKKKELYREMENIYKIGGLKEYYPVFKKRGETAVKGYKITDKFLEEYNKILKKYSKQKIRQNVFCKTASKHKPLKFTYRTAIIVTVVSVFLCMPVYAAISHLLTSALIDDSNRHLIGTETNDRSYIILKDGVYTNEKGKVVDIEELAKSSSEFPESRIVKSSLMPNFIPSSIVEIPTDKSDEMYIIPEIILINNSLCVLTQDNGKGWELTDKDNIVISFDKYKSDITVSQDLIIGYVKDGIMYEGEVFDELSGKYSFSPDEKGEYFFYLLSGSSDYLSLKSGNLEVN